jgi:hypothetical protein
MDDNNNNRTAESSTIILQILSLALLIYVSIAYVQVVEPNIGNPGLNPATELELQWLYDLAMVMFCSWGFILFVLIIFFIGLCFEPFIAFAGVLYGIYFMVSIGLNIWLCVTGTSVFNQVYPLCTDLVTLGNLTVKQTEECHVFGTWFQPIFYIFCVIFGILLFAIAIALCFGCFLLTLPKNYN